MIAANTLVYWTPLDRAGNVMATAIPARTVGPSFNVTRNSDGINIECAILSLNRLVPVAQLHKTRPVVKPVVATPKREATSVKRPSEKPAVKPPAKVTPPVPAMPPQKASHGSVPVVDAKCDVLAVDFLNLLVRAFHAGKPSETHAVRSMFQTVANSVRLLNPRRVVFALDGGHQLRSQLLPQYKAHRPEPDPALTAQKVLAEEAIRVAGFQAIRVADWEADDVIASLATRYADTVVCSCDKDLLSLTHSAVRCRVFHPWGDGSFMTAEEKLGISPHLVTDFLSLCGDSSDGIPGAKGVGEKTAVKLLDDFGSLEAIIVAAMTGQIKGAIGVKIKEQRESVLICRRVVELNNRLTIPELSEFRPAAGWQQRLTAMRLGSVAAIMDSISSFRACDSAIAEPETEPPITETKAAEPESKSAPREASMTKAESDSSPCPCGAEKYAAAGFTNIRESAPPPGTTLSPKFFATWRDGSEFLIDPNTKRHTCFSDSPWTEWRIDSRGPFDPATNAVRKI